LPRPEEGWVVASETTIDAVPSEQVAGDVKRLHFQYAINYRRIAGVKEEKKLLRDVYIESSGRHGEAARLQIEDLIDQQSKVALALRKATRSKNNAEIQRLNDELDDNGRKMKAVHEDIDRQIAQDVEKYLVKDADASIVVSVNDSNARLQQGEIITLPGAAFALRTEGEQSGPTSWHEGQTLILYGDWQLLQGVSYHADIDQPLFDQKAKTIKIMIIADRKRSETLLKQIDLPAILNLMK